MAVTVETRRLLLYSVAASQATVVNTAQAVVGRIIVEQESGTWTTAVVDVEGLNAGLAQPVTSLTQAGTTDWFALPYEQLQFNVTIQPDASVPAIIRVQVVTSDSEALLSDALGANETCPDPEVSVAIQTSALESQARMNRDLLQRILDQLQRQTLLLVEVVGDQP